MSEDSCALSLSLSLSNWIEQESVNYLFIFFFGGTCVRHLMAIWMAIGQDQFGTYLKFNAFYPILFIDQFKLTERNALCMCVCVGE